MAWNFSRPAPSLVRASRTHSKLSRHKLSKTLKSRRTSAKQGTQQRERHPMGNIMENSHWNTTEKHRKSRTNATAEKSNLQLKSDSNSLLCWQSWLVTNKHHNIQWLLVQEAAKTPSTWILTMHSMLFWIAILNKHVWAHLYNQIIVKYLLINSYKYG